MAATPTRIQTMRPTVCPPFDPPSASDSHTRLTIRRSDLRAPRLPQRLEPRTQVVHEGLRLLPRREVTAPVVPGVEDELRVRLLRPALRRRVDLLGERADGDRELHAPGIEEAARRR